MGLKQKRLLRRQKKAEQKRTNKIWDDEYAQDYNELSKLRGEDRQKWLDNYRQYQMDYYKEKYPIFKDVAEFTRDGKGSYYADPYMTGIRAYYTGEPFYTTDQRGERHEFKRKGEINPAMTTQYWIDKGQNLNDIDQRILDSLNRKDLKEKFKQLVNNQKTNNQETNGGL